MSEAPARPARIDHQTSGSLAQAYDQVRSFSEQLCEPLATEDYVVQSMDDVSPTRWHLAHTTWFFETFVLARARPSYRGFHPEFSYLFNSYYNMVGDQFPRPQRGVLSRPTVEEIFEYRAHVDKHMSDVLSAFDPPADPEMAEIVEVGLNHEQQHQELMLTDLKHVFSCNPLYPVYGRPSGEPQPSSPRPLKWKAFEEGLRWIGNDGEGYSYDNERPRHRVFIEGFEITDRLITNGEYLAFIEDGGYERPELWLSEGWAVVQERDWRAPLYWMKQEGWWRLFTLSGLKDLDLAEPVCHVSYYEADAFARWSNAWLPTEMAWEHAAGLVDIDGNFAEAKRFHPQPADPDGGGQDIAQMFGDVWEWTCSPYVGYPGYRPPEGALGEYNGKFMCNQMVLRGGSCATPRTHIRATYRNFFPPDARWQFTGIRLTRERKGD